MAFSKLGRQCVLFANQSTGPNEKQTQCLKLCALEVTGHSARDTRVITFMEFQERNVIVLFIIQIDERENQVAADS